MMNERPLPINVRVELDPRINFAMQQNDVPVVKALHVENLADVSMPDLEIRITAEPEFAQGWSARVATIGEGATYNLTAIDLKLSPSYLGELTERVRGKLWVEVTSKGEVLQRHAEPVELLARDEWSGLSSLPEILAAFVLPNHPVIDGILRSAAEFMFRWTSSPALDGYQSKDPRRVWSIAAAIYASLQQLDLTYVNPPASFENNGQRVRLPDRILESRMATCLDVSLLAAACLEQCGLNALLVLVQGHAFTGVWLSDESFAEPAMEDGLRLRKRVDLNEIGIFDPTGVTPRPPLEFERAVQEAKRNLEKPESFLSAIDIQRARKGHILPLPERVERTKVPDRPAEVESRASPAGPDLSGLARVDIAPSIPETATETPATRLDRWRRKLLDLTLRNRLLNFKDTKKTLPLLCPDLGQLEDMLAEGATFQILPRPADLEEGGPRDADAHWRRTGEEALEGLLTEELKARRLRTDTTPEELNRRLIEIYRAARLGIEEGGTSALYLAIGFLVWYESERSEQRRLAPILLVPLEVIRQSVRQGFTIRQGDDEPRINVTLLELLKQDQELIIPGLDPLPEDESGLDVPAILRTVRQAVRDIDRWDVIDDTRVGFFSFSKFLMWRDLSDRADMLMQNPVVGHLVNRPDQPFHTDGSLPRADRLDEERAPTETYCPLPADSSQLAAVFAAAEGHSFVLEGPPGTGKSQTITNLISHCLTQGKSVLFVSEKMAALNVVHRRLTGVGLERYCLELHSNKSNKREVIEQLEESLRKLEDFNTDEWESEANRLGGLRRELNAYARALHQPHSTGETVFQVTSRLIGLRDVPRVALRWPSPDSLDADALTSLRDVVDRVATAGAACGEVNEHAWEAVRHAEWSTRWEEEIHAAVRTLAKCAGTLAERAPETSERLSMGQSGWSLETLEVLHELTGILMDSPGTPIALLVRSDWDEIQDLVSTWILDGRSRDAVSTDLRQNFSDEIADLDIDALRKQLKRSEASWWPASWWRRRPILKALTDVAIDGRPPARIEIEPILGKASALREGIRKINAASGQARELLGRHWKDGEAEWDLVNEVLDWARKIRGMVLRATGDDFERAVELREKWACLATEGRELLASDGSVGRQFVMFREALNSFREAQHHLAKLADLDVDRAWGSKAAADALGRVRASLTRWQEGERKLRTWCAWRRSRAELLQQNLGPLIEAYESSSLSSSQLRPVFERSYAQWWLGAVTDREAVLSQFFSPEHERKIQQFRDIDERYMQLTRSLVQARLGEKVPASSAGNLPNSEVGILKREVGKKRRHMSVRKLFQKIPNLLPRLKPCLLMSPMSVAQYLDPNYPLFDIVVFDEASQIPVWDAVGAISRGRQAVIVGDPKQLPPTNFFQRAEAEEEADDEDVVEDLESILDDCIGAQIPWLHLDWHYRSRHESLITFSNYHYYNNRLLTFPSPTMEGMGVSWRHVASGVYDKGKSRTNRGEADAVVEEILRRLRDPILSRFSIGVVTFNQAQQTLIEDLLDSARGGDPQLDPYFAKESEEPVFVKNLENVQGDERDVILFSICYGPDMAGKVSMNFGPMNREGGERRLNVAITRARREVIVFSTLRAEQIDLARTRARGVRDLKGYIEYAERGQSAIAEAVQLDLDADFDSPFEEAVYDALVQRGWQVHKQVGCARYRIDLAIVDPEAPGRFLLGVECDGANYHRAKTARDRDKLREAVLRDLGWELHRIWSTDWWTDPAREVEKLEESLRSAREAQSQVLIADDTDVETEKASLFAGPVQAAEITESETESSILEAPFDVYQPLSADQLLGSPEDFHQQRTDQQIIKMMTQVVQFEGPISLNLASRRVISFWGIDQLRAKILRRIRQLIPQSHVRFRVSGSDEFLWPPEEDPANYDFFRVPGPNGEGARQADDLPLEEIANATLKILESHISAPLEELIRETARMFGFKRTGRLLDSRMRMGIEHLLERGKVRQEGEVIALAQ